MPSPPTSSTRHAVSTLSKILLILVSVFSAWHALCFVTTSSSPVIVVISESMEPAFSRGDVLFVWNRAKVLTVGEIAVYWFEERPLPIVHRIIQRVPGQGPAANESNTLLMVEGSQYQYLTKGDNNDIDDTFLYPPGQPYVRREDIVGTGKGHIPYIGWITILLNEHPWLKTAVFGAVVLSSLLRKKQVTPH